MKKNTRKKICFNNTLFGRGVSAGIVNALSTLIEMCNIDHKEIELISHSTTQAVNAFLEGDVSKVGIIGMGVGMEKTNVVRRTHIKDIPKF